MAACAVAAVGADQAAGPPDFARALAGVAVLINPIRAGKWRPAFPAISGRRVGHAASEAIAVGPAPVVVEESSAVAPGAVLAVLACAVLADLAVSDRDVALGGALATVIDWRFDD